MKNCVKKSETFYNYLITLSNDDIDKYLKKVFNIEQKNNSFDNYIYEIKNGIENSKNKNIAMENLYFLLYWKEKLEIKQVSQILAITEQINNRINTSAYISKHYNFNGGLLSDESLLNIIEICNKDNLKVLMISKMYDY